MSCVAEKRVAAARRILAERDVPIVALTGRSRKLGEEAIKAGASSCVLKPFMKEEVVSALLDAIATHAATAPSASSSDTSPAEMSVRAESLDTLKKLAIASGSHGPWGIELQRQARQARRWSRIQ